MRIFARFWWTHFTRWTHPSNLLALISQLESSPRNYLPEETIQWNKLYYTATCTKERICETNEDWFIVSLEFFSDKWKCKLYSKSDCVKFKNIKKDEKEHFLYINFEHIRLVYYLHFDICLFSKHQIHVWWIILRFLSIFELNRHIIIN